MSVTLNNVGKSYTHYEHVTDRLWEALSGRRRHREFAALQPLSLHIPGGQVVGIVGRNGAGKSTLLKLIAGMITPSSGTIRIDGRVSALLELGSGFHPEMSGRENVYLSAAVMGLSPQWVDRFYADIVAFSGLQDFMDQPLKTYSSGMSMRLAFAVATTAEPDILILDETLSVGDGAFARKSFDRIIGFKEANKTILFCSHSMYQVEAICDRAIWIDQGKVLMDGEPSQVVMAYTDFLTAMDSEKSVTTEETPVSTPESECLARITGIEVRADGVLRKKLAIQSGETDIVISVRFVSSLKIKTPGIGITIVGGNGHAIASASNLLDGVIPERQADGSSELSVVFPRFSLLKGIYWLNIFLLCEKGLHVYDKAAQCAELHVTQKTLERGVVSLPRNWTLSATM